MRTDSIPPQPPMTDMMAGHYLEALRNRLATPRIGDTRACPDCGRPQHYTGTEHGWAHDALIDTWHCADPRKGMSDYRRGVEDGADPRVF